MALWEITPVAHPDDPRWLDHPRFERIVVRAQTATLARRVAAKAELPEEVDAVGNESHGGIPGVIDEKLYAVHELSPENAGGLDPEGPDAVLQAVSA